MVPFDEEGYGAIELEQQKVPYVVEVDFTPVLLGEAQLEKKLIINKLNKRYIEGRVGLRQRHLGKSLQWSYTRFPTVIPDIFERLPVG